VTIPVPLSVRLLKVVPPETVWAGPLNITVPDPALKVPLLVQFPLTVKVGVPVIVRVSPVEIVKLRQYAFALIIG